MLLPAPMALLTSPTGGTIEFWFQIYRDRLEFSYFMKIFASGPHGPGTFATHGRRPPATCPSSPRWRPDHRRRAFHTGWRQLTRTLS